MLLRSRSSPAHDATRHHGGRAAVPERLRPPRRLGPVGVVHEPEVRRCLTDSRVPRLVSGGSERFRNQSEAEFAGYRAALDYLQQEDPGEFNIGLVLHLHRLLFSFTDGRGGSFKTEDNLVVDRNPDGTTTVRFEPVSAQETPFFVEELVARTQDALERGEHHPLLRTAAFVLDLLCIHPFGGGTKQDRVRDYVLLHAPTTFTIADVRRAVPGVSDNSATWRRT
ncbi:MAG: Fic family protein [Actinomycetota bacterium]|nr:Fic family protein [Actinomycetota bacterium]